MADGRNEFIDYQPLVTGTYRISVTGRNNTAGEFFLSSTEALSIPTNLVGEQGGTVTVPIDLASLNDGSGHIGLSGGDFVLFYNPAAFAVSNADVNLGTVPSASTGWSVSSNTATPGYLNIVLNPGTTITSAAGGSLVTVNFHILGNAPLGASQIDLAADATDGPDGPGTVTYVAGEQGNSAANHYILSPAPVDNVTNLNPFTYSNADPDDGAITVIPSADDGSEPATHFFVSATPGTTTAGNALNFVVTALDAGGKTATGYTGTVVFSSTDSAANLPASTTLTSGVGTYAATLKTAGSQTLIATDAATTTLTGSSNGVTVYPAIASQFAITAPTSTTAGNVFVFTVTAQDAYGNTTPAYTGTVAFSSSDGQAGLPASATLTSGSEVFAGIFLTAGSQTLTATDPVTSMTGSSIACTVSPGLAAHIAVNAPATVTAGYYFNFTVTVQDIFNNTIDGYTGTVTFSSSDSAATLPASSTLAGGTGIFTGILTTSGTQTLTATDNVANLTGSAQVAVSPSYTDKLAVSAPATTAAGNIVVFAVTAEDYYGNTTPDFSDIVTFYSSDTAATFMPPSSQLTNGTGFFAVVLQTAGSQTLGAYDSYDYYIAGNSNAITVSPLAASQLAVSAPATVTAGQAFNFTVTAEDQFNNTAPTYTGTVTFTLANSDSGAVLPANSTLTSGVGVFTGILTTSGTQTLLASDTSTSSIEGSGSTEVDAAAANSFTVQATPRTVAAGAPVTVTVTALDQYGNTAAAYSGTVTFTSSDTLASTVLPGSSSLTSGVGTFSATLTTAGSQTLTATDANTSGSTGTITGTSGTIAVTAATASHFGVTAAAAATAGSAILFTVTALDPFGNTAPSYAGTVTFTGSDSGASTSLPGNSPLSSGVAVFSATLTTGGSQTLTATDKNTSGSTGTITGTSGPITVSGAAASHFTLNAPLIVTATEPFSFTVTANDQYNNTATSYAGTVAFFSADTAAGLPASATLTGGTGAFQRHAPDGRQPGVVRHRHKPGQHYRNQQTDRGDRTAVHPRRAGYRYGWRRLHFHGHSPQLSNQPNGDGVHGYRALYH